MYHNHVMWHVNQERHEELTETATRQRLIKGPRVFQHSRKARFLLNLGILLIDVGIRLKTRYGPVKQWSRPVGSSR
jgi:hypothetical protein